MYVCMYVFRYVVRGRIYTAVRASKTIVPAIDLYTEVKLAAQ